MKSAFEKIPVPIVIWLLALSFWSGTVYLQVLQNAAMIKEAKGIELRVWDRLTDISHRLSLIQGKLEEQNERMGR